MKITLIIPPQKGAETYGGTSWYFPTGPGYIAAALRDKHDIRVLELRAKPMAKDQIIEWIKNDDSDVYCIGGLVTDYGFIKWLAPIIKKEGKLFIIGGGIANTIPHILFRNPIDVLVIGEADITIKEVMTALEKKETLENINGIMFKKNGRMITTPRRKLCDLDKLPMPAYDLFPTDIYVNTPMDEPVSLPSPFLNIVTTRGCPYECTFCYRPIRGMRIRSVDHIIKELKYLKENYGIKGVYFQDDLSLIDKKRMFEFCDRLEKANLNIKWFCSLRANLIDRALLKRMKETGCDGACIGIESGNQKVLDLMKKQITVEQADNAVTWCKEIGIELNATFVFGMPGENDESIRDTAEFFKRNDMYEGVFFIATPFPGSELWEMAKKMGKITPENEEEFILSLEDTRKLTINFTEWSDEELLEKKTWLEHKVQRAYYRKPIRYIKDLPKSFRRIGKFSKIYGWAYTGKLAFKKIKRDVGLLLK